MREAPPQAVIIAGPNGSGKSTAATGLLRPNMTFVNADLIAQQRTGSRDTAGDIHAGRSLIERLRTMEDSHENFALETTLSSRMLANRVRRWRDAGYEVHLIYFWLSSEDLAIQRVRGRVRDGGHNVSEPTIRRRYQAGLQNFFDIYSSIVLTWRMFDNSGPVPQLVARGADSGETRIHEASIWNTLCEHHLR